jgi:LPS-assembly lipoprotein
MRALIQTPAPMQPLPRRSALRAGLAMGLRIGLLGRAMPLGASLAGTLLLPGCGFKPRGAAELPFSVVFLQAPSASAFASELRRSLRANRIDIATRRDDAPARFELLAETQERDITALSTAGRPREYQVRLRLRWQVRDASDRLLIAPTEMVLRRTITVLDAQGQINPEEEALVLRDMRTDAALQVVRRMAAIRLP